MLFCFTAKSQDVPKEILHADDYFYNGWVINKKDSIQFADGRTGKVKRLYWASYKAINYIYASVVFPNKSVEEINLRKSIDEKAILLPNGIARLAKQKEGSPDNYREDSIFIENGIAINELQSRARNWFSNYYKGQQYILNVDNNDPNVLYGTASFFYNPPKKLSHQRVVGYIKYKIRISFIDGQYRCELYDFYHEANQTPDQLPIDFNTITNERYAPHSLVKSREWKTEVWNDIKASIHKHSLELYQSLGQQMKTPSSLTNRL